MPCATALLVALLPLWIQATSASAQLQFSEDWSHGKRSAMPLRPSSLAALVGALTSEGDAARGDSRMRTAPGAGQKTEGDMCPIDESVMRLVYEAIMREADRVAVCRNKHGLYDAYMTT